jgi:hypothetical protein
MQSLVKKAGRVGKGLARVTLVTLAVIVVTGILSFLYVEAASNFGFGA